MDSQIAHRGPNAPGQEYDSRHHLDPLEQEMLDEAPYDLENSKYSIENSEEKEDAALKESLEWIADAGGLQQPIVDANLTVPPQ